MSHRLLDIKLNPFSVGLILKDLVPNGQSFCSTYLHISPYAQTATVTRTSTQSVTSTHTGTIVVTSTPDVLVSTLSFTSSESTATSTITHPDVTNTATSTPDPALTTVTSTPTSFVVVSETSSVVGRSVLLVGRGLDGRADGWDIREEGDVGGFGGTRALFIPGNVSRITQKLTLVVPE